MSKAIKLFISYSWSSEVHQEWVLNLATELRDNGVDVIIDKWDLRAGQDAYAFMEKMVTDPAIQKVLLICDRRYAEKANARSGGVGTETQIISTEIYNKREQTKFVVAVTELDESGQAYLPAYYKSRIYVDFSNPKRYSNGLEELLRWIYDKPRYSKPKIGSAPGFLTQGAGDKQRQDQSSDRFMSARDRFETFWVGSEGQWVTIVAKYNGRTLAYRGVLLKRESRDEGVVRLLCDNKFTCLPLGSIEKWWVNVDK